MKTGRVTTPSSQHDAIRSTASSPSPSETESTDSLIIAGPSKADDTTGLPQRRNSGAPPRTATPPLSAADKELAAYLLARRADGRPVDEPLRDMLERGNASLEETRELMTLGRGNVRADCKATAYKGWRTTKATRDVIKAHSTTGDIQTAAEQAGVVARSGTGNCGEHAGLTTHLHVARLETGETVAYAEHRFIDHAWSEHTGKDGRKVVLDSWKDGPAVEACDAAQDVRRAKPLYTLWNAHQEGVKAEVNKGYHDLAPAWAEEIEAHRRQRELLGDKPRPWERWDVKPVVAKSFARRARKALKTVEVDERRLTPVKTKLAKAVLKAGSTVSDKARGKLQQLAEAKQQRDARNEQLAAETAISIGASESQAKAAAADIVDGAKHLRRRVPRVAPKETQ